MARTISQIYNSMIAEKESFSSLDSLVPNSDDSQTFLTNLTSTSKVALWRLMFWVCAFAIWVHESLWDTFRTELIETGEALVTGTTRWYVNESKNFQNGDSLIYNETIQRFVYDVIDVDKQIIEQSAGVESNGVLTLKVAKSDGGTGLEKLSVSEETSFTTYIAQLTFAGTQITIITDDPDDLKIQADVFIDGTVLYNDESNPADPLNGSLLSDSSTFPIEDAINNYINTLNFNGIFFVAKLIDAIQSTLGVNNIVVTTCQAKYGSLSYSDILTATGQQYTSNAGYLAIDSGFPLADNLTYINS